MHPAHLIRTTDMKRAQTAADYLGRKHGPIGDIMAHARLLQYLTQIIHRHVEPQLARHCLVANIRADVLVLSADSPVWATRLRYLAPDLVKTLNTKYTLGPVRAIRVRVTPMHHNSAETPNRQSSGPEISPSTAALIQATAGSIEDSTLRKALERLAQRVPHG